MIEHFTGVRDRHSFVCMIVLALMAIATNHGLSDPPEKDVNAKSEPGKQSTNAPEFKRQWFELLSALNLTLPPDPRFDFGTSPDPKKIPYVDREDIYVEHIESAHFENLTKWYSKDVQELYKTELKKAGLNADADKIAGPDGSGWMIELKGYHYHNSSSRIKNGWGVSYLRATLMKKLREGDVQVKDADGKLKQIRFPEFGVSHAVITKSSKINHAHKVKNLNHPDNKPKSEFEKPKEPAGNSKEPREFSAPRYDFTIQFCWQPPTSYKNTKSKRNGD